MATTIPLNSKETMWVTTYFRSGVVCVDISLQLNDENQVTAPFTLEGLKRVLLEKGRVVGLAKPTFAISNGGEH